MTKKQVDTLLPGARIGVKKSSWQNCRFVRLTTSKLRASDYGKGRRKEITLTGKEFPLLLIDTPVGTIWYHYKKLVFYPAA